jgi:X-X-X-Leu-X-X-Gly heptad repeat protein
MEGVAIAVVAAVPPTLAALAAWRKGASVHASVGNTNGAGSLQDQVKRLNAKVDDLADWQGDHLTRWHS